jgi:hypothetical protein
MFKTVATIGAGSALFYEPPNAPGTRVALENALNLGQTGEQGEFVETTPISKKVREYIRGMKTPPDKQITFNDVPGDSAYETYLNFIRDEDNVASIKHFIDYANGRRAEFMMVPNGMMVDEAEGNTQLKMMVFGKQSGATIWSEF